MAVLEVNNSDSVSDNVISISDGSNAEEQPKDEFAQVLAGVEGLKPLPKGSNGESEASRLGYQSKLVSKWFRHECEYNSCPVRWAECDNVDDEAALLTARSLSIPIVHRHAYVDKHWITQSIAVQDPAMRRVLSIVLAKYQDLDLELTNWNFEPPYMPIIHRWEDLKAFYSNQQSGPMKNAAAGLLTFLTPLVAESVISLAHTKETGKVTFKNAWQIFPPSSIVKTKFYGVETICRVVKYKKRPADRCNPEGWVIDMEYVDWNGETSGWATTTLTIWEYEGYKKVTGLPVYPLSYAPDAESIRTNMVQRGKRWAALRGYHFCLVNGTKILLETEEPEQRPVRT
jgi:hypothetical protein